MTEKIVLAIGSVLAIALLIRFFSAKIIAFLSDYQNSIENKIKQAEKIKQDAESVLEKYKKQEFDLTNMTTEIVAKAKEEAENIIELSRQKAKKSTDLRIEIAKKSIDAKADKMIQEFDKRFIGMTFHVIKDQLIKERSDVNLDSASIVDGVIKNTTTNSFH